MFPKSTTKILSLQELLKRRRAWARQGRSVVFSNGVFDLLHAGHVDLLERARELGDVLIVGINSDASVRLLEKGSDRPINPLKDRMRIVAALACVDAAISFSRATPEDLIAKIKPDVLIKGADYSPEQVAGRRHAKRLELLRLKKGYSTTRILARIRASS